MSTLAKAVVLAVLTLSVFFSLLYFRFPNLTSLQYFNPRRTALMIERGVTVDQAWVPFSQISPYLKRAVVEAEDGNFYRHNGIDLNEFRASLRKNIKKRKFARGFSTITMQLAKNLYLAPEKTVTRKLLEIAIALRMEKSLSKDRILELYLNLVEWGNGIYGAEAASRHYFKKSAARLSPSEAAFLAGILPNPRKWGRWPPGSFVARRQQAILARMGIGRPEKKEETVELPELPDEEETAGETTGGSQPFETAPERTEPVPADL